MLPNPFIKNRLLWVSKVSIQMRPNGIVKKDGKSRLHSDLIINFASLAIGSFLLVNGPLFSQTLLVRSSFFIFGGYLYSGVGV